MLAILRVRVWGLCWNWKVGAHNDEGRLLCINLLWESTKMLFGGDDLACLSKVLNLEVGTALCVVVCGTARMLCIHNFKVVSLSVDLHGDCRGSLRECPEWLDICLST